MGIFRRAPLLTNQVRVPAGAILLSSFSGTIDTSFTAAVSFATQVDKTFTAAASFAVLVSNAITASASFATQVDKTFTASASFQKWETTFTASVSFQGTNDKNFTASVSFRNPTPSQVLFTASVSFSTFETGGSNTVYYPYPESFEPHYEVRLVNPTGQYVDVLDDFNGLDYTLATNDVGACILTLPSNYPLDRLKKDYRIEVWRGVGIGPLKLEGQTQFLIQGRERSSDEQGHKTLKITGLSLNHILKRRVVAYRADQVAYVDVSGSADDIMKLVVRTNLGATATDASRVISSSIFSVDPDRSLGQVVWKNFPHKNVLDVLKDLANSSYQLNVPLYFDIVADQPPNILAFRTWAYTRGADRRFGRNSALLLGPEYGSVGAYTITEDWSNEISYVYAAGPGEEDVRDVQSASDSTLITQSPFARSELWVDSQDSDTSDKLLGEAGAALIANRTKKVFTGKLLSTPKATYGVHWSWGDYVTVEADDDQFDCNVASVHVSLVGSDKREAIDAGLRSD